MKRRKDDKRSTVSLVDVQPSGQAEYSCLLLFSVCTGRSERKSVGSS